jgi:hypothetical protein
MRAPKGIILVTSLAALVGASPAIADNGSAAAPAPAAPAPAPTAGSAAPSSAAPGADPSMGAPASNIDPATVKPEDMPTAVRMRRLEQKTQALKERAWQLKARIQMLKEQMIGGGVGAQALITHSAEMGSSFRLIKLIYTLDGTQVFVRTDEPGETLYKAKSFDVFAGPISPGNHNVAALATYRGHGYGVFEYLSKYTFTASGNAAFSAGEGKTAKVECRGYEKGGPTVPLEKRAAIDCKITQVAPAADKAAPAPAQTTPGSTPLPGATPAPTGAAPSGT